MKFSADIDDYPSVRRSRKRDLVPEEGRAWLKAPPSDQSIVIEPQIQQPAAFAQQKAQTQRGHALTFSLLFLYTVLAYFRPWELTGVLAWLSPVPYWLAVTMSVVFLISQLMLEGNLTARPREVNLILILTVLAALSIPQAINPSVAWTYFNSVFLKTIIVFVVISNVLRTRLRMQLMIFLALAAGCYLSVTSLSKYVAEGSTDVYRAKADIFNIFSDPNALALHLVMMMPIALTLLMNTHNILKKLVYAAGIVVMLAGMFATFSRGGFLALLAMLVVLTVRLLKRNRAAVLAVVLVGAIAAIVLAPGGYAHRLSSILDPSQDEVGSASARRDLLLRSIGTAVRRPLLGVGIGNFQEVSIHNQVSHNAYTQIAAEMGIPALVVYLLFLVTAYKRLRRIEHETVDETGFSRYYYLSIGLQASLAGYVVGSFFLSVAFEWFVYFLVGYAICLSRTYEADANPRRQKEPSQNKVPLTSPISVPSAL